MSKGTERDVTLQELKDIIFFYADSEMKGYLHAMERMSEEMAEIQRQRYVSIFQIIDDADLNEEFNTYRNGTKK